MELRSKGSRASRAVSCAANSTRRATARIPPTIPCWPTHARKTAPSFAWPPAARYQGQAPGWGEKKNCASEPPRRSSKKESPTKLAGGMKGRWRVVLLRSKGEILGQVEAPDAEAAKAPAAVQFDLDEIQRNRIMVQELA